MSAEMEKAALFAAMDRYPDEVAKTLGGVRHGFIEGALWAERQLRARRGGDNTGMPTAPADQLN